ncbi:MAG: hypothetical protein COA79_06865 [Planctomycetota bacterium]|nr:MAG: hypothetical protein COA79_06865 [Planctomycetota bacterium]
MNIKLLITFVCLILFVSNQICISQEKKQENSTNVDLKKITSNQWIALPKTKYVIPKTWENGRHKGVNSFGSEVYCEKLGLMLSFDGYTDAPSGKSTPGNYSDSIYGFNPETAEMILLKRSNWVSGARSRNISNTSYPLDLNKIDPCPCPRHSYNGICYNDDNEKFYLINGANAGLPNEHPKYKANGGTGVHTFWEYDINTKKWKQLEYPKAKKLERVETVLRAVPSEGALYLIQQWSVLKYDIKAAKWTSLIAKTQSGVYKCDASVDPIRKRILLFNGGARIRKKGQVPTEKNNMCNFRYYDITLNKIIPIPLKGAVKGKIKAGLCYIDTMDCYAVRTEVGMCFYFPKEKKWKKPVITQFIPKARKPFAWCYLNFDRKRNLLVLRRHGILRLDPKTLKLEDLEVQLSN